MQDAGLLDISLQLGTLYCSMVKEVVLRNSQQAHEAARELPGSTSGGRVQQPRLSKSLEVFGDSEAGSQHGGASSGASTCLDDLASLVSRHLSELHAQSTANSSLAGAPAAN